jgi:hypothetical protein
MPKKKEEKLVEDPTFRAVAIPYRKNFSKFAASVEETLNKFYADGFHGEISTHPQGLLYVGRRMDQRRHPLQEMMKEMLGQAAPIHSGRAPLSQLTRLIMGTICEDVETDQPETFASIVQHGDFLRRFQSEDLKQAIAELEADIASHTERCDDPACHVPKLEAAVIEQLKRHIALHVS